MAMPILLTANKRQMKRWIRSKVADFRSQKNMVAAFEDLEKVFAADLAASRHSDEELKVLHEKMTFVLKTIAEQTPVHSSDLAIKGTTILEMIRETELDIRDVYAGLLKKVQDGVIKNEETALMDAVKKKVLNAIKKP